MEPLAKRKHVRLLGLALAGASCFFSAKRAYAGGFELPDQGAQSLGRGGAFVAKADDSTALYYNPAGLARQRGTKLQFSGNVQLHSFTFTRAGAYPDAEDTEDTPWGQQSFPTMRNAGPPFLLPMVLGTTDFGYFDRLTLGFGVFGPSAIGNRTFQLGIQGAPAPSRYDAVQSKSTIYLPTLGLGFRVTRWLDVGASGSLVLSSFDQTTVSYVDLGEGACKNAEYYKCDGRSQFLGSGKSFTGALGVMLRPSASVQIGTQFKLPTSIRALGNVNPKAPAAVAEDQAAQLEQPAPAQVDLALPWVLRTGIRYVEMDQSFEVYDLELDVTYEAWKSAQTPGPTAFIPDLGLYKNVTVVTAHNYKDTFSVRLGGAYNFDAGGGIFTLRGGAFYDSSATDFPNTRIDFDTLNKVAGTMGVGYKYGGVSFNLAYAAIASLTRTVTDGKLRPSNPAKDGDTIGANDQPLPTVNDGTYKGFTHTVGFSVELAFDALFGSKRQIHYGDPSYEDVTAAPEPKEKKEDEEKKDDDKKDEEKKDDDKKDDDKKEEKKDKKKSDDGEKPEKPEKKRAEETEKKPETKKPLPKAETKKPEPKPEPEPAREEKKPAKKGTDGTCKWGEC